MRVTYANPLVKPFLGSTRKGADQLVWLAETDPGQAWQPGSYYEKRKIATRVNPQSADRELARRLWDMSEARLATVAQ